MAYEMKPNTGTLFRNDRKEKDSHPDYQGECFVGGHVYRMAAWIKDGKKGKFMSFSFSLKGGDVSKREPAKSAPADYDDDSQIPF